MSIGISEKGDGIDRSWCGVHLKHVGDIAGNIMAPMIMTPCTPALCQVTAIYLKNGHP